TRWNKNMKNGREREVNYNLSAVPDCPDLSSLENESIASSLDNLLLCFCQVIQPKEVSVICLYGSTPDHLRRASEAVNKAGMTVTQLSIQHMEFDNSSISSSLFRTLTPSITQLDIRECSGNSPLTIADDAFEGMQDTLVNVTIHDCKLSAVPSALASLPSLSSLVLSSNNILALEGKPFDGKTKLKYLDLSGNQITDIDEGTFESITNLESLLIGDHNYLNETLLNEIARLGSLQVLDLSRADGIFTPPSKLFTHLPALTTLKMGGCSLSSVEMGAFSPLAQLEALDLRVNLIENISALAFDGLGSLKRLSLAGNYIRKIETNNWAGLGSLEDLDIGWNELHSIDSDAFESIETTLTRLDMRHNPINELPPLSLPKLDSLTISETNVSSIEANTLHGMPKLTTLEAIRTNLSSLSPSSFSSLPSLRRLLLSSNLLRSFPVSLSTLPSLELLSLSENPFLCDSNLKPLIDDINSAFRRAAQEGRDFSIPNTNETLCARPWTLKGKGILSVDLSELTEYNESLDTTTAPSTTTTQETVTEAITLPPFSLPDLFAGKDSNESIFKDDRERLQYDLTKTDTTHQKEEGNKTTAFLVTLGILLLVTLISIFAIVLFIKKRKQSVSSHEKKTKVEDGMVEIELESGKGSRKGSSE
ncbi:lron-9, partial [Pristionchus pacificus]|uniref:Lron-9 n=1 Tax=Pristionchus pacificus TaxID=54126 RepID=A0A2A6C4Z6_PRIPA